MHTGSNEQLYVEPVESTLDLGSKDVCMFLRKGDYKRVISMVEAAPKNSQFILSQRATAMLIPVEDQAKKTFTFSREVMLKMLDRVIAKNGGHNVQIDN